MGGLDANTKLLFHFDGNDGAMEIVDSGVTGHVVTQVGTAILSTANKKFGSTSLLLDGNSDYITMPDSDDWDIPAGSGIDWTLDLWIKYANSPSGIDTFVSQLEDSANQWYLLNTGGGNLEFYYTENDNSNLQMTASAISDTDWHHIAIIKYGTDWGLYLDGTQVDYGTASPANATAFSALLAIGERIGSSRYFDGYIDEVRIQHSNDFSAAPNSGKTDTITVPTAAHVADGNTKLLLHMDALDVSGDGSSGAYHIPNFVATTQLKSSKFGNGCLLLDGNGDYLSIADSADWEFGSGDFTIDYWEKRTGDDSTNEFTIVRDDSGGYTAFVIGE